MKTACFVLVIAGWAALMCGIAYAIPSNQVSGQAISESREKTIERPRGGEHDAQVRGQKDQTGGELSNGNADDFHASDKNDQNGDVGNTRALSRRRLDVGHAKQAPSRQARSVKTQGNTNLRKETPATAVDSRQSGSRKSAGIPDRIVNSRNLPVRPRAIAVLDGPQFKNPRNRGSSLAIRGGPANSTRNTAVINGTGMKRKP